MRRMKNLFSSSLAILSIVFILASCSDALVDPNENNNQNNNGETTKTGQVAFEATDGPIDDASVQGAFVTISEIKIDGETYEGFSGKQTIDLLAYQNGETKIMGLGDMEVGTYSEITLVLDYDADVNGDAPGCYILTADNMKHSLEASADASKELVLNTTTEVEEDATTTVLLDFDLRKAVTYAESNSQNEFEFVTDAELEAAIRVMNKAETGAIEGQVTQDNPLMDYGDKVVVYAYKTGSFDSDMEVQGQGESQIQFANATSSAVVDANGDYTIAFLEEGDYELHFISYEDNDNDGRLEVKGMLQLTSVINANLNNISIEAGASATLDISIMGILPL